MKHTRLTTCIFTLTACAASQAALVLTEVEFTENAIEITNTDTVNPYNGNNLQWCVPFTYGELAANDFAPGETRVYFVPFDLAPGGDDLWIYDFDGAPNFFDYSEVLTGVVWGSNQAGSGRVNDVVTQTGGTVWAVNTDFVPTAGLGGGQTLQLDPGNPAANTSANWGIAANNLGTYAIPEPHAAGAAVLASLGLLAILSRRPRR